MDKVELSEIRARLRAESEVAGRRPSRPLLAPLRALLGPPAPPAAPRPALPPARRVGLNPTPILEDETELFLARPVETSGRNAFGQRAEPAPAAMPLLRLTAPEPPLELTPEATRWTAVLASGRPAAAMAETPYHPEDFSDPAEGEAERLYAAAGMALAKAGLAKAEPVAEPAAEPVKPSLRLRPVREAPPPAPAASPEQELLIHLERVFLAELAGIRARRI